VIFPRRSLHTDRVINEERKLFQSERHRWDVNKAVTEDVLYQRTKIRQPHRKSVAF
jgi:hypothetical protein